MKKKKFLAVALSVLLILVALPVAIFAEGNVPIDEAHFPDANFRAVVAGFDADGNGEADDRDSVLLARKLAGWEI